MFTVEKQDGLKCNGNIVKWEFHIRRCYQTEVRYVLLPLADFPWGSWQGRVSEGNQTQGDCGRGLGAGLSTSLSFLVRMEAGRII